MATASTQCGASETIDDRREESHEFRSHLMALFILKASLDEDIEDFGVWRRRTGKAEGDRDLSSEEEVVLAYKRYGIDEMNTGGWSFLRLPAEEGKAFSRTVDIARNASPESNCLMECYRVEVSKDREIFSCSDLLKIMDDIEVRKELSEKVMTERALVANVPSQGQTSTKTPGEALDPEVGDFFENARFSFAWSNSESLKAATKEEILRCIGTPDPDSLYDRLVEVTKEKLDSVLGGVRDVISGSELRGLREELKAAGDKGSGLRYNVTNPVSDFVGRGVQLGEILSLLGRKSGHWEIGPVKRLVLSGLGGLGKSELAREYCRRHSVSLYDDVAWINADSEERIAASFKALAFGELGLEERTPSGEAKNAVAVVGETVDLLKARRTLLVYDNAESLRQVKKYLPNESVQGRMHVILTSRSRDWSDYPTIHLESFHPEEGLELLRRSTGHLPCWNEEDALRLCQDLSNFPLALKQAASYFLEHAIQQKEGGGGYSIRKYSKALGDNAESLLNRPLSRNLGDGYSDTTHKVFVNTLRYLKQSLQGQVALNLLNVLSYLSPDSIDVDAMADADHKYGRSMIQKSVSVLSRLCVVSVRCGKLRIHRMIQTLNRSALRNNSGMEDKTSRVAMGFALSMGELHALSVWEHAGGNESFVREFWHVPHGVAEYLFREGLYDVARSFSSAAVEELRKSLGPSHQAVLHALRDLSHAKMFLGDSEGAAEVTKECLDALRGSPGEKDYWYFSLLCEYGGVLRMIDKYEESKAAYQEVLSEGPVYLGADSELIQRAGRELGSSPTSSTRDPCPGEFVEVAVKCHWERVEAPCDVFRRRMTDAMSSVNGAGSFEELNTLAAEVEADLGEKHAVTLKCKVGLCQILLQLGRFEEARRTLDVVCSRIAPSCRGTLLRSDIEGMRGQILFAMGETEGALPHFVSCCLSGARDSVDACGTLMVMGCLKRALDSGKYEASYRVARETFSALSAGAGKERIPTFFLRFLEKVGTRLSTNGFARKGLEIMKNVYQCYKLVMGETHLETLRVKCCFANICLSVRDGASDRKGLKYLSEVKAALLSMDSDGDPRVRELLGKVTENLMFFEMKCMRRF